MKTNNKELEKIVDEYLSSYDLNNKLMNYILETTPKSFYDKVEGYGLWNIMRKIQLKLNLPAYDMN